MLWLTRSETSAAAAAAQPGVRMQWHGGKQTHVDTIVFVHGILGHYVRSWGHFPRLLAEDPDLPDTDILLWGYRTGFFARHNRLQIEAGHLTTALESMIRECDDIVLVGHSMGGLIILKGLVDRMNLGHAQAPPCHAVAWVSLFASPLNGVWLAGMFRRVFLLPLWLLRTLHRHMHDLSRGDFVKQLMADVHRCIYAPVVENERHRKVPIRIIAATRDGAVDKKNRDIALADYANPSPYQLDETHTSIKLPTDHADMRYRVLALDLQTALTRCFHRLCNIVISVETSEDERTVALREISRRYSKVIQARLERLRTPRRFQDEAADEFLLLMANFGASQRVPAYIAADKSLAVLHKRFREWQ